MNLADILNLNDSGHLNVVEGIDPSTSEMVGDVLSIGDHCILPVHRTSRALPRDQDLALEDETGVSFATFCFTKGMLVDDPNTLTAWQYVAFLSECDVDDIVAHGSYTFLSDYVIVDRDRIEEYLERYRDGSTIWGGFSHEEFELSEWCQPSENIRARAGLSAPTTHHQEAFQRYLHANNSFDRFLRLYHTVELLFDFVIFKKIQGLGDDLIGYGDVVRDQTRGEYDRLCAIFLEFCGSPDEIGSFMNLAAGHEETCQTLFQDYSKETNPLKDNKFGDFWPLVEGSKVSVTNIAAAKIGKPADASRLLVKVAAYWVYRVRCSIAHNRVGEFILTDGHDDFVGGFATPLLANIVEQILSNEEFKALTD
jgi:hypothetical protein